jgi:hypothetical protein
MKTALEWLEDNLLSEPWAEEHFKHNSECWDKAKEMEKDNVCDAWDDGYDKGMRDRIEKISTSEYG